MSSKKQKVYKDSAQEEKDESSLNLTDIIGLSISNWKWFVLSLTISLSVAYIYLRKTPPIYTRTTSIMVKDDANNQAVENIFQKVRGGRTNTSVSLNNEMIALSQPTLMVRVAQRLKLDYEYQIRGKLRNTTLYGSSQPIVLELPDNVYGEYRITLNSDRTVTFTILGEDDVEGKSVTGPLDKSFQTPIGTVAVRPTASFYLPYSDPVTVSRIPMDAAGNKFASRLVIGNTKEESTVIDLSLNDVNIERADDVLNTLIAVYNEDWITNRNQIIKATNKFIGERLEAIEAELGDVENEMTDYKVSNHTLDFAEEGGQYVGRSMEYDNRNLSFENEVALTKYFRDYINKVHDFNQTLPLTAGINNAALQQQVGEYNGLVLQRSNLIAATTEANPLVGDIDKKLQVLQHGIVITVDNHLSTLQTQMNLLHANTAENNQKIDETPTKQRKFVDIERRRKIKEQLYTFLLQTREQNELQQAFEAYNTRVLQTASGSNAQTFPNNKKIWMLAFAIGFLLPLAYIIIREWSNTKVRGRRDIDGLPVPFVGELPLVEFADMKKANAIVRFFQKIRDVIRHDKGKKSKKRKAPAHVVVKAGSRNVINEAYRVLRTNLEFVIGKNKDMKVIMTTSANPGSGKTFLSYNLALCMSLKGKRVCAIDLDLRRRSLSDYVGKPELGVSDYINGAVDDWHDLLVKPEGHNHLHILPVGTLPPNPAEIISYDRFADLIAEVREEFDYVFFDCPPVEIVADTSILAKYADITLFIVRVGLMEKEFLNVIEEYYYDRKFNNMGIILNGTLTANSRYGYRRYGYRYGYGYGYGYGGYGYGNSYSEGYSKGAE